MANLDYSKLFDLSNSESLAAATNLRASVGSEKEAIDVFSMEALGENSTAFFAQNANTTIDLDEDDKTAVDTLLSKLGDDGSDPERKEKIKAQRKKTKDDFAGKDLGAYAVKQNINSLSPEARTEMIRAKIKGYHFQDFDPASQIFEAKGLEFSNPNPAYNYSKTDEINLARSNDEVFNMLGGFVDANGKEHSITELTEDNTFIDENGKEHLITMEADRESPVGWKAVAKDLSSELRPSEILSAYGFQPLTNDGVFTTVKKKFTNGVTSATVRTLGSLMENTFWKDEGLALQNRWYAGVEEKVSLEKEKVGLHDSNKWWDFNAEGVLYATAESMGAMLPSFVASAITGNAQLGFVLSGMAMGDAVNQELREMGVTDPFAKKAMFWGMTAMGAFTEGAIGMNRVANQLWTRAGIEAGSRKMVTETFNSVFGKNMIDVAENVVEKEIASEVAQNGSQAAVKKFGLSAVKDLAQRTIEKVSLKPLQEKVFNNSIAKMAKAGAGVVADKIGGRVSTVMSNAWEEGREEVVQYLGEVMIKNTYDNLDEANAKFNQGFSMQEAIDNFVLGGVASVPFGMMFPKDERTNIAKNANLAKIAQTALEENGGDYAKARQAIASFIDDKYGKTKYKKVYANVYGENMEGITEESNEGLKAFKANVNLGEKLKQDFQVVFDTMESAKGNLQVASSMIGSDKDFLTNYVGVAKSYGELFEKVKNGETLTKEQQKAKESYEDYFNKVNDGTYRMATQTMNFFKNNGNEALSKVIGSKDEVYKQGDTLLKWNDSTREYTEISDYAKKINSNQGVNEVQADGTINAFENYGFQELQSDATKTQQMPFANALIKTVFNKRNQIKTALSVFNAPKATSIDLDSKKKEIDDAMSNWDNDSTKSLSSIVASFNNFLDEEGEFDLSYSKEAYELYDHIKERLAEKLANDTNVDNQNTYSYLNNIYNEAKGVKNKAERSQDIDSLIAEELKKDASGDDVNVSELVKKEKEKQRLHYRQNIIDKPISESLENNDKVLVDVDDKLDSIIDKMDNGETISAEQLRGVATARAEAIKRLKAQSVNDFANGLNINDDDKKTLQKTIGLGSKNNDDAVRTHSIEKLKGYISKMNIILKNGEVDERKSNLTKYRKHYGRNLAIIGNLFLGDNSFDSIIKQFDELSENDNDKFEALYLALYEKIKDIGDKFVGNPDMIADKLRELQIAYDKIDTSKKEKSSSNKFKVFHQNAAYNYTLNDIDIETMSKGGFNNIKELAVQLLTLSIGLKVNPDIVAQTQKTTTSKFELDLPLSVGGISIEQLNTMIAQSAAIEMMQSKDSNIVAAKTRLFNYQRLSGIHMLMFLDAKSFVDKKYITKEVADKISSLSALPLMNEFFINGVALSEYDKKAQSATIKNGKIILDINNSITLDGFKSLVVFLADKGFTLGQDVNNFTDDNKNLNERYYQELYSSFLLAANGNTNQLVLNGNAGTGKTAIMMSGMLKHQALHNGPLNKKSIVYIAPSEALKQQAIDEFNSMSNSSNDLTTLNENLKTSNIKFITIDELPKNFTVDDNTLVIADEFTLHRVGEMNRIIDATKSGDRFLLLLGDPNQVSSNFFKQEDNASLHERALVGQNITASSFGFNLVNMSQSFRTGVRSLSILSAALRNREAIVGMEHHKGNRVVTTSKGDTTIADQKGVQVVKSNDEVLSQIADTIVEIVNSGDFYSIEDLAIIIPSERRFSRDIEKNEATENYIDEVVKKVLEKIRAKGVTEAQLSEKELTNRVMHFDRNYAKRGGGIVQGLSAYKVFVLGVGIDAQNGTSEPSMKLSRNSSIKDNPALEKERSQITDSMDKNAKTVLITAATRMKHDSMRPNETDAKTKKYGYLVISISDANTLDKKTRIYSYSSNVNKKVDTFDKVQENRMALPGTGILGDIKNATVSPTASTTISNAGVAAPETSASSPSSNNSQSTPKAKKDKISPVEVFKNDKGEGVIIEGVVYSTLKKSRGKYVVVGPNGDLYFVRKNETTGKVFLDNNQSTVDIDDFVNVVPEIAIAEEIQTEASEELDNPKSEATSVIDEMVKQNQAQTNSNGLVSLGSQSMNLYTSEPYSVNNFKNFINRVIDLFKNSNEYTIIIKEDKSANSYPYKLSVIDKQGKTVFLRYLGSDEQSVAIIKSIGINTERRLKPGAFVGFQNFTLPAKNAHSTDMKGKISLSYYLSVFGKNATAKLTQEVHGEKLFTVLTINIAGLEYKNIVQNKPTDSVVTRYEKAYGNFRPNIGGVYDNESLKNARMFLFHLYKYNKNVFENKQNVIYFNGQEFAKINDDGKLEITVPDNELPSLIEAINSGSFRLPIIFENKELSNQEFFSQANIVVSTGRESFTTGPNLVLDYAYGLEENPAQQRAETIPNVEDEKAEIERRIQKDPSVKRGVLINFESGKTKEQLIHIVNKLRNGEITLDEIVKEFFNLPVNTLLEVKEAFNNGTLADKIQFGLDVASTFNTFEKKRTVEDISNDKKNALKQKQEALEALQNSEFKTVDNKDVFGNVIGKKQIRRTAEEQKKYITYHTNSLKEAEEGIVKYDAELKALESQEKVSTNVSVVEDVEPESVMPTDSLPEPVLNEKEESNNDLSSNLNFASNEARSLFENNQKEILEKIDNNKKDFFLLTPDGKLIFNKRRNGSFSVSIDADMKSENGEIVFVDESTNQEVTTPQRNYANYIPFKMFDNLLNKIVGKSLSIVIGKDSLIADLTNFDGKKLYGVAQNGSILLDTIEVNGENKVHGVTPLHEIAHVFVSSFDRDLYKAFYYAAAKRFGLNYNGGLANKPLRERVADEAALYLAKGNIKSKAIRNSDGSIKSIEVGESANAFDKIWYAVLDSIRFLLDSIRGDNKFRSEMYLLKYGFKQSAFEQIANKDFDPENPEVNMLMLQEVDQDDADIIEDDQESQDNIAYLKKVGLNDDGISIDRARRLVRSYVFAANPFFNAILLSSSKMNLVHAAGNFPRNILKKNGGKILSNLEAVLNKDLSYYNGEIFDEATDETIIDLTLNTPEEIYANIYLEVLQESGDTSEYVLKHISEVQANKDFVKNLHPASRDIYIAAIALRDKNVAKTMVAEAMGGISVEKLEKQAAIAKKGLANDNNLTGRDDSKISVMNRFGKIPFYYLSSLNVGAQKLNISNVEIVLSRVTELYGSTKTATGQYAINRFIDLLDKYDDLFNPNKEAKSIKEEDKREVNELLIMLGNGYENYYSQEDLLVSLNTVKSTDEYKHFYVAYNNMLRPKGFTHYNIITNIKPLLDQFVAARNYYEKAIVELKENNSKESATKLDTAKVNLEKAHQRLMKEIESAKNFEVSRKEEATRVYNAFDKLLGDNYLRDYKIISENISNYEDMISTLLASTQSQVRRGIQNISLIGKGIKSAHIKASSIGAVKKQLKNDFSNILKNAASSFRERYMEKFNLGSDYAVDVVDGVFSMSANGSVLFTATVNENNKVSFSFSSETTSGDAENKNIKRKAATLALAKFLFPNVDFKKQKIQNVLTAQNKITEFEEGVASLAMLMAINVIVLNNNSVENQNKFKSFIDSDLFKDNKSFITVEKSDKTTIEVEVPTGIIDEKIDLFAKSINYKSNNRGSHTKVALYKGTKMLNTVRANNALVHDFKKFADSLISKYQQNVSRLSAFYNSGLVSQRMDGGVLSNAPTERRKLNESDMEILHILNFLKIRKDGGNVVVPAEAEAVRKHQSFTEVSQNLFSVDSKTGKVSIGYQDIFAMLKSAFDMHDQLAINSLRRLYSAIERTKGEASRLSEQQIEEKIKAIETTDNLEDRSGAIIKAYENAIKKATSNVKYTDDDFFKLMRNGAFATDFKIAGDKVVLAGAANYDFGKGETIVTAKNRHAILYDERNIKDVLHDIYKPLFYDFKKRVNQDNLVKQITKNFEKETSEQLNINDNISLPKVAAAYVMAYNVVALNLRPTSFGDPNAVKSPADLSKRMQPLSMPYTIPMPVSSKVDLNTASGIVQTDVHADLKQNGAKVLIVELPEIESALPDFSYGNHESFSQKISDGAIFISPRLAKFFYKGSGGTYGQADTYTLLKLSMAQTDMIPKGLSLAINPERIAQSEVMHNYFKKMYNPKGLENGTPYHYFMEQYNAFLSAGYASMDAWDKASDLTDIYITENGLENEVLDIVLPTDSVKNKTIKYVRKSDFDTNNFDTNLSTMRLDITKVGINVAFNGDPAEGDVQLSPMQQLINLVTGTMADVEKAQDFLQQQQKTQSALINSIAKKLGISIDDLISGNVNQKDLVNALNIIARESGQGAKDLSGDYMKDNDLSTATAQKATRILQFINKQLQRAVKPRLAGTRTADQTHTDSNIYDVSFWINDNKYTESFVGESDLNRFIAKLESKNILYTFNEQGRMLKTSVPLLTEKGIESFTETSQGADLEAFISELIPDVDWIDFFENPYDYVSKRLSDANVKKAMSLYGDVIKEMAANGNNTVQYRVGENISASNIAGKWNVPTDSSMADLFWIETSDGLVDMRTLSQEELLSYKSYILSHDWFRNFVKNRPELKENKEALSLFYKAIKAVELGRKTLSVRTPSTNAHSGIVTNTIKFNTMSGLVTYYNPLDMYARGSDLDGDQSSMYHLLDNTEKDVDGIPVEDNNNYISLLFDYYADSRHFPFIFKPINVDSFVAVADKRVPQSGQLFGSSATNASNLKSAADGEAIGPAAIAQKAITFATRMPANVYNKVFKMFKNMSFMGDTQTSFDQTMKGLSIYGDAANTLLDNAKLALAGRINLNSDTVPLVSMALFDENFLSDLNNAGIYSYNSKLDDYHNRIEGIVALLTSVQMNDLFYGGASFFDRGRIERKDIVDLAYKKLLKQKQNTTKAYQQYVTIDKYSTNILSLPSENGIDKYNEMLSSLVEDYKTTNGIETEKIAKEAYDILRQEAAVQYVNSLSESDLKSIVPENNKFSKGTGNIAFITNAIVERLNAENKGVDNTNKYISSIVAYADSVVNTIKDSKFFNVKANALEDFRQEIIRAANNNEMINATALLFDLLKDANATTQGSKIYGQRGYNRKKINQSVKDFLVEKGSSLTNNQRALLESLSSVNSKTDVDNLLDELDAIEATDKLKSAVRNQNELSQQIASQQKTLNILKRNLLTIEKMSYRNSNEFADGLYMIYKYAVQGASLMNFAQFANLNQFNFNDTYSITKFIENAERNFGVTIEDLRTVFSMPQQKAIDYLQNNLTLEKRYAKALTFVKSKTKSDEPLRYVNPTENKGQKFLVKNEEVYTAPFFEVFNQADWLLYVASHPTLFEMTRSFLVMESVTDALMVSAPAVKEGVASFRKKVYDSGSERTSEKLHNAIERSVQDFFYALYANHYLNNASDFLNGILNGTTKSKYLENIVNPFVEYNINLSTATGRYLFLEQAPNYIYNVLDNYRTKNANNDTVINNKFLQDIIIEHLDEGRVKLRLNTDPETGSQEEIDYAVGLNSLPKDIRNLIETYMLLDGGLGYNYGLSRYMSIETRRNADAFIKAEMAKDHNNDIEEYLTDVMAGSPETFVYRKDDDRVTDNEPFAASNIQLTNWSGNTPALYDTIFYDAKTKKYYKLPFNRYAMTLIPGQTNRVEVVPSTDAKERTVMYPLYNSSIAKQNMEGNKGKINGLSDQQMELYAKGTTVVFLDGTKSIITSVDAKTKTANYDIKEKSPFLKAVIKPVAKAKKAVKAVMKHNGFTQTIQAWINAARQLMPGVKIVITTATEASKTIDNIDAATKSFVFNGTVYILTDRITDDVTVHELFGHALNEHIKIANPDLWNTLVDIASEHPLFETIANSPAYDYLITDDPIQTRENIADEVIATAMGNVFANNQMLQSLAPLRSTIFEKTIGVLKDLFYRFFPKSFTKALSDITEQTSLQEYSERIIKLAASKQYKIDAKPYVATFMNNIFSGMKKSATTNLEKLSDITFATIDKLFIHSDNMVSTDQRKQRITANVVAQAQDPKKYRKKVFDDGTEKYFINIYFAGMNRSFEMNKIGSLDPSTGRIELNNDFINTVNDLVEKEVEFNNTLKEKFFDFLKDLGANNMTVFDSLKNGEDAVVDSRIERIDTLFKKYFSTYANHLSASYKIEQVDKDGQPIKATEYIEQMESILKEKVYEQIRRTLFSLDYDPAFDNIYIGEEAKAIIDADSNLLKGLIVIEKRGKTDADSKPIVINRIMNNSLSNSVNDTTPSAGWFMTEAEQISKRITLDNSEADLSFIKTAAAIVQHKSTGKPLMVKSVRAVALSRNGGLHLNNDYIESQMNVRSISPEDLMRQFREMMNHDEITAIFDSETLKALRNFDNYSTTDFADNVISALDELEAMAKTLEHHIDKDVLEKWLNEIRGFRDEYQGDYVGPTKKEAFLVALKEMKSRLLASYQNNSILASLDPRVMTINKLLLETITRDKQFGSISESGLNKVNRALLQVQELSGGITSFFRKGFDAISTMVSVQLGAFANDIDAKMEALHKSFGTDSGFKISRKASFKNYMKLQIMEYVEVIKIKKRDAIQLQWDNMKVTTTGSGLDKAGNSFSFEERVTDKGERFRKVIKIENGQQRTFFQQQVWTGKMIYGENSPEALQAVNEGRLTFEQVRAATQLLDALHETIIDNMVTSLYWANKKQNDGTVLTMDEMKQKAEEYLQSKGYVRGMLPNLKEEMIEAFVKEATQSQSEGTIKKAFSYAKRMFSSAETHARKNDDIGGVDQAIGEKFDIKTRIYEEFSGNSDKSMLTNFYKKKGLIYNETTGEFQLFSDEDNQSSSIDIYNISLYSKKLAIQNRATYDVFLPIKDAVLDILSFKNATNEGEHYEQWRTALEDLWDVLVQKKEGDLGEMTIGGIKINFTSLINMARMMQSLSLFGFNWYQLPKSAVTNTMELIFLAVQNSVLGRDRAFKMNDLKEAWRILSTSEGQALATAVNNAYFIVDGTPEAISQSYLYRPEYRSVVNADLPMIPMKIPDLWQRKMGMVAQMIAMGTWQAHSLNEQGNLVYDETKDRQYYQEDGTLSEDGKKLKNLRILKRKDEGLQTEDDKLTGAFDSSGIAFIRGLMNIKAGSGERGASTPLFQGENFASLYLSITGAILQRLKTTVFGWTGDHIGALKYTYIDDAGKTAYYDFTSDSMVQSLGKVLSEMKSLYDKGHPLGKVYEAASPEAQKYLQLTGKNLMIWSAYAAGTLFFGSLFFGDDEEDELRKIQMGMIESTKFNESQLKIRKRLNMSLQQAMWETHYHVDMGSILSGWIDNPTTGLIYMRRLSSWWEYAATLDLKPDYGNKKALPNLVPVSGAAWDFMSWSDYEALQEKAKEKAAAKRKQNSDND